MPTSLKGLQDKLQRRLQVLDSAFERHLVTPSVSKRVDRFAIQEGFVSALWQTWCIFCRDLLIYSSQGAITRGGMLTASPHSTLGALEIAYVAKQLANRNNVVRIRPLSGQHQEHTWGDLTKLNLVVSGIGCSNEQSIRNGLSACLRIEDLQICRNASAHISSATLQQVKSSRVRYMDTSLNHPSDMIFWVDPTTKDFLWKSWIEEAEVAAEICTQ